MSKHRGSGNITRHFGADPRGDRLRCLRCGLPIVYGERCPECERELRLRQRVRQRKRR